MTDCPPERRRSYGRRYGCLLIEGGHFDRSCRVADRTYGILRWISSKKFMSTVKRLTASRSSRLSGCGAITIRLPSGEASKFGNKSKYRGGVGDQTRNGSGRTESA